MYSGVKENFTKIIYITTDVSVLKLDCVVYMHNI